MESLPAIASMMCGSQDSRVKSLATRKSGGRGISRKRWLGTPENSQVDLLQIAFVEDEGQITTHCHCEPSPLVSFASVEELEEFWQELGS